MLGQSADFSEAGKLKKVFKPSFQNGAGKLKPVDGAIQYTVEDPSDKDFDYLFFQPARLRASQNFEVVGTFKNDGVPESSKELVSIGIEVYQAENLTNRVSASLSVARVQGYFSRTVFTQVVENSETLDDTYTADLRLPITTTFKLVYDSKGKTFSTYYDKNEDEPVEWEFVGSFGIAGSGGDHGNANWRMRSSEKFLVYVYGYSENLTLYDGEVQVLALSVEAKK
ncbi:MAG: hypothetical protein AAF546_07945 [Verrucomicrobiota bacterium]